jgi:lysophospholipase L1-like esterase
MVYGTIACLGDSMTYGARCEGRGWVERLPRMLAGEGVEWATLNRGICGETTWQILQRAPAVAREIASMGGAKWAVVFAGTNDSKACPEIDGWAELLRQTVAWFRRSGVPVVLVLPPPVDPFLMPAFHGRSNAWLAEVSKEVLGNLPPGVRAVVDLGLLNPSGSLIDGVHFSALGHLVAAEAVRDALRASARPGGVPIVRPFDPSGRFHAVHPS